MDCAQLARRAGLVTSVPARPVEPVGDGGAQTTAGGEVHPPDRRTEGCWPCWTFSADVRIADAHHLHFADLALSGRRNAPQRVPGYLLSVGVGACGEARAWCWDGSGVAGQQPLGPAAGVTRGPLRRQGCVWSVVSSPRTPKRCTGTTLSGYIGSCSARSVTGRPGAFHRGGVPGGAGRLGQRAGAAGGPGGDRADGTGRALAAQVGSRDHQARR